MKSKYYTFVCEGQTEEYLFHGLKTTIFKNKKIHQCKKHKPNIIKGTLSINDYIDGRNCCIVFYLIDNENIEKDKIIEHNKNIKNKNGKLIISKPCLEIILLAIFKNNINVSTLTKNDLFKKLTRVLISKKIINKDEKYSKSDNKILEKIINFLEKDGNEYIKNWIKNISKLKFEENNIEFNNFDLIIKYLKEE